MTFPDGYFGICSKLQWKTTQVQLFPTIGTEKWGERTQVHSWHPSPWDQAPPNQHKQSLNDKALGSKLLVFVRKLVSFILAIKPSWCLSHQPGAAASPGTWPGTSAWWRGPPSPRNQGGTEPWHWPRSAAPGKGQAEAQQHSRAWLMPPQPHLSVSITRIVSAPASTCSHYSPHKKTQQTPRNLQCWG